MFAKSKIKLMELKKNLINSARFFISFSTLGNYL